MAVKTGASLKPKAGVALSLAEKCFTLAAIESRGATPHL
jgi:hypothetical protein